MKKIVSPIKMQCLFKFSKINFSGCGCSGIDYNSDAKKNEMKLKAMNYDFMMNLEEGNYENASEIIENYIKEIEKAYGAKHKFYLSALNNKAYVMKLSGEKEESRKIYAQILDYYESSELLPEDIEKYVVVKNNLATILKDLNEINKSLAIFEEVIKLINQNKIKDNIVINVLIAASGTYTLLKQYYVAEELLNKAQRLIEENYGDENLPLSYLLVQKGNIYKEQKEFTLALDFYEKSISIKKQILDENHIEIENLNKSIEVLKIILNEDKNSNDTFEKNNKEEVTKEINDKI